MLVESVIGNILTGNQVDESIDWLDLTWMDCRRRFARKQTRGGREVRLLLRLGQQLRHGDLLGNLPKEHGGQAVAVNLLETDVFVIRCDELGEGPMDRVALAYEIGNLHEAMQVTAAELLVPCGHEAAALLQSLASERGINYTPARRVFEPTHWPTLVQRSDNLRISGKS